MSNPARVACPHTLAPPVGILCASLPFRTLPSSASYVLRPNLAASRVRKDYNHHCRHRHLCSRRRAGVAEGVGIIPSALSTASLRGRRTQPLRDGSRYLDRAPYVCRMCRKIDSYVSCILACLGLVGFVSWLLFFKRKKSATLRTTVYTIRNIYFHQSLLVIGDGCFMLFVCRSRTCAMELCGSSYNERCVPID